MHWCPRIRRLLFVVYVGIGDGKWLAGWLFSVSTRCKQGGAGRAKQERVMIVGKCLNCKHALYCSQKIYSPERTSFHMTHHSYRNTPVQSGHSSNSVFHVTTSPSRLIGNSWRASLPKSHHCPLCQQYHQP